MQLKIELLISIVNYHKSERVKQSVLVLSKVLSCIDYRVVIVDNSSCDSELRALSTICSKKVEVLSYDENLGYTKATNLSLQLGDFDPAYILILNPDVILSDTFNINELFSKLNEDSAVGLIGVKQINDDGSFAPVVRNFPTIITQVLRRTPLANISFISKYLEKYEYNSFNYNSDAEVDWLQSSLWILRADTWRKLDGLDERFFLFMSDPDFCKRLEMTGYKSLYVSSEHAYADGKRASAGGLTGIFRNKVIRYHCMDALKYYFKWFLK